MMMHTTYVVPLTRVNVRRCSADSLMFVRCFQVVLEGYRSSSEFSISIVDTCIRLTLGELSDDKDGVKNGTPNAVVLKVITTSLLAGRLY